MDMNKFQILEFDLSGMVKDPSIVMIAKRGSGKSFITRDIIYHYRHIPGGVVIAPTDKMNPFYKEFFSDLYIHYEINDALLKKILTRQKLMIKKQEKKKSMGKKIDPSGILIMDDCLASKRTWSKCQSIMEILMNGRHYRLTYILTMQTPLGITPDLRLNFDYVFLLKEDSYINKKKLWENYASMFPSLVIFEKVFGKCTEDYKAMVIDNRKPADNLSEKVFWFKAQVRKFDFGCANFIKMHETYYNQKYDEDDGMDVKNFFSGKKKNDIDFKIDLK